MLYIFYIFLFKTFFKKKKTFFLKKSDFEKKDISKKKGILQKKTFLKKRHFSENVLLPKGYLQYKSNFLKSCGKKNIHCILDLILEKQTQK